MSRPRNKIPKGLSRHQVKYAQATALAKIRQGLKAVAERYDMTSESNRAEIAEALHQWLCEGTESQTGVSAGAEPANCTQGDCSGEIR